MEDAASVPIPPLFLCPISLEIMSDPVSLPTGITYDRRSIEQWIFNRKYRVSCCPVTKQLLPPGIDLIPNHTLRRLIQSWCTANSIQHLPAPCLSINAAHITNLLTTGNTELIITSLSSLISDSHSNKLCIMSTPAALDFLASLVNDSDQFSGEALKILNSLKISDRCMFDLISRNAGLVNSLIALLQVPHDPNEQTSRGQATLMLKSIIEVASPNTMSNFSDELYRGLVRVIHECHKGYKNATKASLKILCLLFPWGRNRIKAVEARAVPELVELLIEEEDKRTCELAMMVLDRLCGCAEGRAELVRHGAGIAVVSKKILRVSDVASARAVSILYSVSNYSATRSVVKEMLQVGVVSKLCSVVTGDCCELKTREKAREILKLHSGSWKDSPCVYPHLRASYPTD